MTDYNPATAAEWEDRVVELGPRQLLVAARDDLPDVTPAMVHWWFANMDRELYLRFHPVDHKEFAWVRGKEPGGYVGATHLTHQMYGGEGPLMRAEITFVPPAINAAVSAEVRLAGSDEVRTRFVHLPVARAFGTELRSAWWIDIDDDTNLEAVTNGRLRHVHEEFAYLAEFLPELYAARS